MEIRLSVKAQGAVPTDTDKTPTETNKNMNMYFITVRLLYTPLMNSLA